MKKIIACVVAVAMLLSLMPMAFAAENPGITAKAEKAGDKVTLTVTLPAVTALTSCAIDVLFDPAVVSIPDVDGYAAAREIDGEMIEYFSGLHTGGIPEGKDNIVKNAFISTTGVNKTKDTPMAIFEFTIIDNTVANTTFDVTLFHYEDAVTTIDEGSNVAIATITIEINDVEETEPEETEPEETEPEETEPEETEPALPDNVLEIIKKIEDFFNEYGLDSLLEVPEVSKAIENIARIIGGDMDLEDILEELNKSLEGFKDILDEMGLPLPSIDEIIDFIMGLFGGGDNPSPNPNTTTTSSNGDVDDDDNNIDDNDENGDKQLGDAGIALAVSVCLTAAAAFVITKKKHDEE